MPRKHAKYWTLKREARRGAALLKRLQLQLETFSSMEMTRRDYVAMVLLAPGACNGALSLVTGSTRIWIA